MPRHQFGSFGDTITIASATILPLTQTNLGLGRGGAGSSVTATLGIISISCVCACFTHIGPLSFMLHNWPRPPALYGPLNCLHPILGQVSVQLHNLDQQLCRSGAINETEFTEPISGPVEAFVAVSAVALRQPVVLPPQCSQQHSAHSALVTAGNFDGEWH
jgi:hypothetical protein